MSWPGKLPSSTVDAPVHVVDWRPTLAELCGYDLQDMPEGDGRNILLLLTGERVGYEQPRTLYWVWGNNRNREAVHRGDWKLVREDDDTWELYNLSDDPREQHDLSNVRPDKVESLLDLYRRERTKDWGE